MQPPLTVLLQVAQARDLHPEVLGMCNSGDSASYDRSRVVGYAAVVFLPPRIMFSTEFGTCLLGIARQTIAHALGCAAVGVDTSAAWLAQPAACFVTLTQYGQLRGCIGTLHAHRSLFDDLQSNAVAAALHDPRFEPVKGDDLESLRIEVSVLSGPRHSRCKAEAAFAGESSPACGWRSSKTACASATFSAPGLGTVARPPPILFRASSKSRSACRRLVVKACIGNVTACRNGPNHRSHFADNPVGCALHWHVRMTVVFHCDLCPRDCQLHEGQRGACFVRMCRNTCGIDNIRAIFGFLHRPHRKTSQPFLSRPAYCRFGTAGCNLAYKFCQNWDINIKSRDMDRLMDRASPNKLLAAKPTVVPALHSPTTIL